MGTEIGLAKHAPEILEAASKIFSSMTADNQANTVEKVMEALMVQMFNLANQGKIDADTLLKYLEGMKVDKDYTTFRGKKKSVSITFG